MSQALINLAIMMSPILVMGLALLIHDAFSGKDYEERVAAEYEARRAEYLKMTQVYEGDK